MAKPRKKKSKPRSQGWCPELPPELQEIVDQAVAETLSKLGIPQVEGDSDLDEGELEIDWLSLYQESPRLIATGFRLQKSSCKTRHRLGGRLRSPLTCGACGAPLLLFANLDATDRRLRGKHSLKRLPLLYCCACPGPVYYHIAQDGEVIVLPSKSEPYDESPFENPSSEIPTGYLDLKPISASAETNIFRAVKLEEFDQLDRSQLREVSAIIGRKPGGRWDMYFSQIGGVPLSFQGDEGKPDVCPNRKCLRRRKRAECRYLPLAVLDLWNDRYWKTRPSNAVQIVYHICPGCYCVSAKYTCT